MYDETMKKIPKVAHLTGSAKKGFHAPAGELKKRGG